MCREKEQRERNKIAARLCRLRKAQKMQELDQKVQDLSCMNNSLQNEVHALRSENFTLKNKVWELEVMRQSKEESFECLTKLESQDLGATIEEWLQFTYLK